MKRTCTKCNIEKDTAKGDFQIRKTAKGTLYFRAECKECRKLYSKSYYELNREKIIQQNVEIKKNNPERTRAIGRKCAAKRKEKQKRHNEKNRDKITKQKAASIRKKRENDPAFKLRSNISRRINKVIRDNGGVKGGKSISKYMGYSGEELLNHLQKLFESWMTIKNYGKYNPKTWNDCDPITWNWNIDHIIPQSKLPYTSMEDENFKKCWALSNLRPYSAKQNLLDGITRVRHLTQNQQDI